MIFIELPSEFSYVFQFHEKRKRERKKGRKKFFERIFLTLTNFQFLERLNWIIHSQLFRNFPNRLRINIKTRVWCLIPESKQAHVPIFSKRKFTTFHTHTHTHTATKECTRHQKVAQLSRSVVAPFALSTPLPRFISPRDCDLRPRTPLPFCFSLPLNPESTIFIAFHRSFVSILDRSIDSYDICLPVQMLRRIFTRTKFLLWNYLVSFSFVRRDCCYFFPSDGKWSIAWKVVGNISRGDKLKNCFGFEFFRQESSTDFLKFGFHPNENSREENNLFRRISF